MNPNPRSSKVVLLGDSLTEYSFNEDGHWAGKLAALLIRKADVLVRGYSGYNTAALLKYVLPSFDRQFCEEIGCLTLCIGANDAWEPTNHQYNPGLSVELYKTNLVTIVEFLMNNGLDKKKILLITPPTIVPDQYVEFCRQTKNVETENSPERMREYVDAMIDVGKQFGIKTFDLFELTTRDEHTGRWTVDGLHLSDYGAKLLYELIRADVERLVEQHRGTNLPNLPTYLELDFNRLESFYTAESTPNPSWAGRLFFRFFR